jgi:hypothetical protein
MFVEHKEVGEVSEAPAKITKLSQAIREGAKLRGECRGAWFIEGRSCALMAAVEATGGDLINEGWHGMKIAGHLRQRFPTVPADVVMAIPSLVDSQHYSREQCASWLEAQGY